MYLPPEQGPFPVVLYFHGGGWVIADKDVYDGGARALAKASGAAVVSVDYRRAPEHPFPAAWNDAMAAYRWLLGNPARVDGDGGRIALAGESAGGQFVRHELPDKTAEVRDDLSIAAIQRDQFSVGNRERCGHPAGT